MMVRKDDKTGESFTLIDFDNTAYGYRSWERKLQKSLLTKAFVCTNSKLSKGLCLLLWLHDHVHTRWGLHERH